MLIFGTIAFMAVAFAAVTTSLIINGSLSIGTNRADFGIYFSKAFLDSKDVSNRVISTDGQSLTFETRKLNTLGDSTKLEYEVTNASKNYDALVRINCEYTNLDENTSEDILAEYIDLDYSFEDEVIPPRSVSNGTISVFLKKSIVKDITVGLSCSLEVDAQERDTLVDNSDISSPDEYDFSAYLVDNNGFIIPDTNLVVIDNSNKIQYLTTNSDGLLNIKSLDLGFHDIYLIKNKTIDEIKEMTDEEIIKIATTKAHFTQSSKEITFEKDYKLVKEVEKKKFNITFNPGAGTVENSYKDVYYTETYGSLPTPTLFGHKFLGWYTDESYTKVVDENSKVYIQKNQTLYAKWKEVCLYLEGQTWDFTYKGAGEEFIIPCNGTYKIEIYGAGGDNTAGTGNQLSGVNGSGHSTSGSKATGTVEFQKGLPIYIYLGQKEGTFNGGGSGGRTIDSVATSTHGSGASDIRLIKASDNSWYDTSHSSWNTDVSLLSRIITAGGGGGVRATTGRAFNGATPLNYYHNSTNLLYGAYHIDGESSNGQLGLGSNEVTGTSRITDTGDIGNGASGGGGWGYYGGRTSASSRNYTYSQFSSIMGSTGGSGVGYGIVGRDGVRLGGTEVHAYSGTSYINNGYSFKGNTYSFTNTQIKTQQNNGNGRAKITLMTIKEEE